jgi:uncharacterized protein (DUF2336 family)
VSFPTHTRLPFISSLIGRRDAESRRVLLRVSTDEFASDSAPTAESIAAFAKEALPLLLDCDPATRLIVARKIGARRETPPVLLNAILERGGDAALFLLERAVTIPREALLAAASGQAPEARAVAERNDLDDVLVALLASHPSQDVALTLAGNPTAPIYGDGLANLSRRANADEKLAHALLARPAAPLDLAALFLYASSSQRAAMLIAAQRAELAKPSATASRSAIDGAAAKLERHALARQPALFVTTLAHALGCDIALAERIVAEPSGEPLVVALAALGAPEDASMRILLLGDAVSLDYKRLGALTRLKDALHPAAARRNVSAMAGVKAEPNVIVEPALDPTAAPTPSRAVHTGVTQADAPRILRRRRALQIALGRREA